ncbi:MAG: hypothetical protein A3J97_00580 [Spirochaetes bacterium RIFOXYC1_FULL_54_7]|nr:MAG: hypothetical protein A3J97_00580 [Spirochaetes bacterium RIFOXYC1_FULL_54_7]
MKVLVASKSFGKADPAAAAYLEERGIKVVWTDVPNPGPEDLARQVPGFDALIVGNDTVDRRVVDAADCLRIIHMHGTGLDAIDVGAATEKGILVANAPGANRNAVAEMTLCLMLSLGRRLDKHLDLLRKGRWERSAGNEVSDSTVGIIGLGYIGRRVAELLEGFGVRLLGYDPYPDSTWATDCGLELMKEQDQIFAEADWVVLCAPLTEATEGMINRRTLSLMKRTAYLVNTARGGLVDEAALCEALQEKRIAGAALDAFAEEPLPPDSPLRGVDILLTPHIAATSVETAAKVSWIVSRNVAAALLEGSTAGAVNAGQIARNRIATQTIGGIT